MKLALALILPGVVLAGCKLVEPPPPPPPPPASGIGFVSVCEKPLGSFVSEGKGDSSRYTFALNDGDIGGCASDKLPQKNAPYWERAELRQQGHIGLLDPQVISFDARFRHGFSGRQESFFQIENSNPACVAEPSLMLKWHRGELELSLLQASGHLKAKRYPERKVGTHRSWSTWRVRLARTSDTMLAIDILSDGMRVGRGHIAHMAKCGTPHVRFGIFRPGNTWDGNGSSVVEFRKFSMKTLKPRRAAATKPVSNMKVGPRRSLKAPKS